MTTHGSVAFGLLNRDGLDPSQADLRDEHVHEAVEVFAVIGGRGQVSLRLGDYVYAVLCEKGDVLVIPAGVRRWVDLGTTRSAWRCACLAANRGCSRSSPAIRWPGSLPAWMSFEVRFSRISRPHSHSTAFGTMEHLWERVYPRKSRRISDRSAGQNAAGSATSRSLEAHWPVRPSRGGWR